MQRWQSRRVMLGLLCGVLAALGLWLTTSLAYSKWQLVEMKHRGVEYTGAGNSQLNRFTNYGDGPADPPRAGLAFRWRTVQGMGHCNGFSGRYSTSGNQLRIDELLTQMKVCLGRSPAHGHPNDLESFYLFSLQSAESYDVSWNRLVIVSDQGQTVLVFRRRWGGFLR